MASDLQTIQTRIDEIDAKLAAGVKSASIGDQRTDFDLEALTNERERLQRIVNQQSTNRSQFRKVTMHG